VFYGQTKEHKPYGFMYVDRRKKWMTSDDLVKSEWHRMSDFDATKHQKFDSFLRRSKELGVISSFCWKYHGTSSVITVFPFLW
jgi:hypothetical protein